MVEQHTDIQIDSAKVERLLSLTDVSSLSIEGTKLILAECRADSVALLFGERSGSMAIQVSLSAEQAVANPTTRLLLQMADLVVGTSEPLIIERDHGATYPGLRRVLRDEGFRLAIGVPLVVDGKQLGVLVLLMRQLFRGEAIARQVAAYSRLLARCLIRLQEYQLAYREYTEFSNLFHYAAEPLIVVDIDALTIGRVNYAAEQLTGYTAAELFGQPFENLVHLSREERQLVRMARARMLLEANLVCHDGHTIPLALSVSQVVAHGQQLVLGLRDLSEQWRPLQHLMLADRLAGMSRLTAVIAHQINNPLQAIASTIQLLTRPLETEKRERYLRMANGELERVIGLVRRTLEIYQPIRGGRRPVAINTLIDSVLEQFRATMNQSGIVVEQDQIQPSPVVVGISTHLREMLSVLIQYLITRMPEGGKLSIHTSIEDRLVDQSEQMVIIECADTGAAIPAEALQELFEPFYESKDEAADTGLAICYSIIEHHAGRVLVSSGEAGMHFRIMLPTTSMID